MSMITETVHMQHLEIFRLVTCLSAQAQRRRLTRRNSIADAARWSGSSARVSKGALEDLIKWYFLENEGVPAYNDRKWAIIQAGLGEARTAKLRRKVKQ